MQKESIILGAGPAGLSAGYELARSGRPPLILEKTPRVGGIARTENYRGYSFDIGGHRFYTKEPNIESLWRELLGADLLEVRRSSRIYYQGTFLDYPLNFPQLIKKLGTKESLLLLSSYLTRHFRSSNGERSFEDWITNRFGRRLFLTFFKDYTEKVWGVPCSRIEAEWAEQRIKGLTFVSALSDALLGRHKVRSLIKSFLYPRLGPGMMWQRLQKKIVDQDGELLLETPVVRIHHDRNGTIQSVTCCQGGGTFPKFAAKQFFSSIPLTLLVNILDPPPPKHVLKAANALSYRDFLLVVLIMEQKDIFPDQWIYIHDPTVKMGRIQNYGNWSPDMVPDPTTSSLGIEFFCNQGDHLWEKQDDDLIRQAGLEIEQVGLASQRAIMDANVIRVPKAYPVYELGYRHHLDVIHDYLDGFNNLQLIGRNGTFQYNNMDHAMLSGINAARAALGLPRHQAATHHSPYLESPRR